MLYDFCPEVCDVHVDHEPLDENDETDEWLDEGGR